MAVECAQVATRDRHGGTSFLRVNVWRHQAEHLADSLSKGEKRSVTEVETDEVGASLKWATAKVARTSQRGNGDRASGRVRQAERGGDVNEPPPF